MSDRLGRRAFFAAGANLALGVVLAPRLARGAAPALRRLEGAELEALFADVKRARAGLKTLTASFSQARTMALLAATVTSKGTLAFVAPDRLRWALAPPDDVVYWVGPEGLSYRAGSSRPTTAPPSAKAARGLEDLRVLLGGDVGALRKRYALSASRSDDRVRIAGSAKAKGASVKGFTLELDPKLVAPRRAELVESDKDKVVITFSRVVLNGPVDPRAMRP